MDQTYGAINAIKSLKPENVVITLIGGGNNGSLYEFIESPRLCVLSELKNYKIISFPQTVVYDKTDIGRASFDKFKILCRRCKNLTLVAREKYSYELYKGIVGAKALLMPDIVFSLDKAFSESFKRENWVALILRDDKEKAIGDEEQNRIIDYIKKVEMK